MKTKTKKLHLTLLIALLSIGIVYSQKAEQPDNVYKLGGKINDMVLTEVGTLVLATNDGLSGIKPENSSVLFNFTDYGRVKPEELFFVPMSPYVIVDQSGFGGMSTKKAVIDYLSGQTLFSSEKNGWKIVYSCDVIMPQNKLVVSGQRSMKEKSAVAIAVYNLENGDQESFFTVKGNRIVSGTPLLLNNDIIVPTGKELFNISMSNGEISWTAPVKNVGWMVADDSETNIYTFESMNNGDTKINKINKSGGVLWDKERKVKGAVTNFEILPNGLAVVSNVDNSGKSGIGKLASSRSESKIAFLSATDGDDLWEKAPKTKGYVQHFYIMDDGILFGLFEGGINKISFDGNTLFKKPLKTGEDILTMAQTPQGLIYITGSDANIVNLNTGDQVWEKPLQYKKANSMSSTYDAKNKRYLIAADGNIFAIDENSGASSVLAEVKLDGKENPTGIEIRDNGILLTSDQNMMMLNWDGSEQFHKYYAAPGKSAAGAIFMGITALATAATAAASYNKALQNRNQLGFFTETGERHKNFGNQMVAHSAASINEMLKKFNATAATENDQFILTKLDDGVGLVKVNKDDGSVSKEIVLKDKKPEYEIDDFSGVLYYKADNSTIYLYDLKK